MKYFDAHAHIQFDMYDGDREALVEHMKEQGVGALIVGVDEKSSREAIALCENVDFLYPAVGIHPNYVTEETSIDEIRGLAALSQVRAIGECGLDYFRPENVTVQKPLQQKIFQEHIDLAVELQKPLMIHGRPSKGTMDAYEDMLVMLEESKKIHGDALKGNIHFFVGTKEIAARFVALNFTLSFTAVVTFTHDYDEVIASIPLTHILTETDSPYVAPARIRGKRNDPLSVKDVVERLALLKNAGFDEVRGQVIKNAQRAFAL
jgi:TatD DNase family protein